MPRRSQRECVRVGCRTLVDNGYCAEHASTAARAYDRWRGDSTARGYDSDWAKFRKWFLAKAEHCVCEDCGRAASVDVHHIKKLAKHPELRLVESNCMGLCRACHNVRTKRGE